MAHLHKKIKNGRPYYYIREIARVKGKPKVINQVYLGSPERIMTLAAERSPAIDKLQVQEFGSLWLADLVDKDVGLVEIVDSVVPKGKRETGPSVGEYFFYAVLNRLVDSRSKRALPEWYKSTAIQNIRPVDIEALSSQAFWKKWDKVTEGHIELIADNFFKKIAELEPPESDCFLFDTTNYFTFMASKTDSDLAQRGKNKAGRDWLRQVGVALLVSRGNRVPFFYQEYAGNRHDSKVFGRLLEDVIAAMDKAVGSHSEMTIVFDKGMNSEENITAIDSNDRLGFITTYSTYYAEELIHIDLEDFAPVDTEKNRLLHERGREDDQILAWRASGDFWGKTRAVVVTYNPLTATRQRFSFEKKLSRLQDELYGMKHKVSTQATHWKNAKVVEGRYHDACAALHLPTDLYTVELFVQSDQLCMNFRKNHYRINRHIDRFGKNIIITNRIEWSTDEIVRASLDRYMVEDAFRDSNDDDLVTMMPIRHWTDSKIRCHILTCMIALTYLRLIGLRLKKAGLPITPQKAIDHMRSLHSCLVWQSKKRKPERVVETPTLVQQKIMKVFGFKAENGVLQKTT